jgi:uncharacterized protein YjdB
MKRILFTAVAALSLMACQDNVTAVPAFEPKVTTIVVTPTASQVEAGRTVTLTAVVKDQRDSVMTGKSVTWASNNTSVATVTANVITAGATTATVTGVTKGTASIVASVEGKVTTVPVFVVDPTVATVSVTATVPPTFFVGQTLQATSVARDSGNNALTSFTTTWTSSTPTVASVSATGLITALSAGTTTITATTGGKTGTLNVTVSLVPVARVLLTLPKPAHVGRPATLVAELRNSSGTALTAAQRTFGWHSSDESIATISSTGVLTGLTYGTTIVTCVVENRVGTLVVNVTEVGIDYIVVSPDSSDLKVGATRQYTATAFDADSVPLSVAALNGRPFEWTTTNSATARVSNIGLLLGIAPGTTFVSASIGTVSDNAKVVIVP